MNTQYTFPSTKPASSTLENTHDSSELSSPPPNFVAATDNNEPKQQQQTNINTITANANYSSPPDQEQNLHTNMTPTLLNTEQIYNNKIQNAQQQTVNISNDSNSNTNNAQLYPVPQGFVDQKERNHILRIDIPPPEPSNVELMNGMKNSLIVTTETMMYNENPQPQPQPQPQLEPLSTTSNASLSNIHAQVARKQLATEWKTSSEYALHILFTKFVRYSESMLNQCLKYSFHEEPQIVNIIGEGVDKEFDKIIKALGYIARTNPKPVIDAMMFWRKAKSELATKAGGAVELLMKQYKQSSQPSTPIITTTATQTNNTGIHHFYPYTRRHQSKTSTGSISSSSGNSASPFKNGFDHKQKALERQIELAKEAAFQADRKSMISIYILCRVLIEIVKQCVYTESNLELIHKLEEIVFTQLKTTDPLSVSTSIIRSSNWNSFAELLGCMSDINFVSVSDRFIASLEKVPVLISKEEEPNFQLLILGMRYLKLKNYPLERFEEGADCIKSIAKFFSKSQNIAVKLAYADVLTHLLLPLVGDLTAEVNHPDWVEAMEMIINTCTKLKHDHKSWASWFKLTVTVLCVSPQELFSVSWLSLIEDNAIKLKSKSLEERINFAVGISRLVWVYLFRCTESLNNTEKSLKRIFSLFIKPKKKDNWVTTDSALLEPLVDILVTISYQHSTLVIENILLPLLKLGFNGSSLDNVQHEKLMLTISAYKGLLLSKERPSFPSTDTRNYDLDLNIISNKASDPNSQDHEEMCSLINKLFLLLDSTIGSEIWSPENEHQRTPSTPFQHISSFGFSFNNNTNNNNTNNNIIGNNIGSSNGTASYDSLGNKSDLNVALFAIIIEVIPCCLAACNNIPFKSTIEILSRNAVHKEQVIHKTSEIALRALASKKNPYTLITWFAKYSFDFDEKTQSSYNTSYLSSTEYQDLLILYTELLECWLEQFQRSNEEAEKKEIGLDGIHLPFQDENNQDKIVTQELEYKNTCTVIEEVEGNGLFFLCSHDAGIRRLALKILRSVAKFDSAMCEKTTKMEKSHSRTSSSKFFAESGSRLIDILNTCDFSKLVPADVLSKLSTAEKSRLAKLSNKHKKGVLVRLAESDYGVDAALWMRGFPKLLNIIFKSCPITMALCRSIVCIRLVQLHEIILSISNNTHVATNPNVLPENIVSEWKLFLIVACSLLTSTNEQKMHLPVMKTHGRKKSQQIFTVHHQKIKSARSIFKMLLPLLNTKNPLVKDAIISGLSCININIFKAFLESVEKSLCNWNFESQTNQVRMEIFHILNTSSSFLKEPSINEDEWILRSLANFLQNAKKFLEDPRVQISPTFQPLRVYFSGLLCNYYKAIVGHPDIMQELFPFEARTSCFNYLMEWCGYGQYSKLCKEMYSQMLKHYHGTRDITSVATSLEFYRTKLETSSLECMVTLLQGPVTYEFNPIGDSEPIVISFDINDLLIWINSLFSSDEPNLRQYGCSALRNLLQNNVENKDLYNRVLKQCFFHSVSLDVTELYYKTICESLLKGELKMTINEDDAVTLGLYGIISENRDIRTYAIDLLSTIESELHNSSYTKVFKERIANDSKTVYKATAKEISNIFAELPTQEQRLKLYSKLCLVLELLTFDLKHDLLILLLPWVHKFVLKNSDELDTFMVLNNTVGITVMCNDIFPMEVEQLWISLGKGNSFQNLHVASDYIIKTSILSRNPEYVKVCKDIILYLSNVPGGLGVVDKLLNSLEPKFTIPNTRSVFRIPENTKYDNITDVFRLINYTGKDVHFSRAQISTIFLVNLLSLSNEAVSAKIPLLLHICLVFLDHYIPIIQESAAKILCDLIYALNPSHEKSEQTVKIIKDNSELWAYNQLVKDKKGARSPKTMDLVIKNILLIISGKSELQEEWQRIACKWATTCSVRHIACRSFQIFRSLLTFLDLNMLEEMLHRLSNTIADENPDIQGFSMQILMTFNALTAELSPEKLIDFPQLFWALCACLQTIHEQEFIEVLSSLIKFVSKIDLDSIDTVQCLIATFPSDWEGKFNGLQEIIMIGLRSCNSYELSMRFLDRLNLLKDTQIVANSNTRLLYALLANIPRFMYTFDKKEYLIEIQQGAENLIELCAMCNQPSLSRLIDSLANNKFRSKKDFISQIVSFISRNYFPDHSGTSLVFFLGLLFNSTDWIRLQVLEFLKYIFPLVDLTRPEFSGVGADLISPLLSLLLTDYDFQALEVLNCVHSIQGSKIDKDILRISMGNKEIKKNYAKIETLFYVPDDEGGWSIPKPAIAAASTRHNVHAVYSTCHIKTSSNIGGNTNGGVPSNNTVTILDHNNYTTTPTDNITNNNNSASVVVPNTTTLIDNANVVMANEVAGTNVPYVFQDTYTDDYRNTNEQKRPQQHIPSTENVIASGEQRLQITADTDKLLQQPQKQHQQEVATDTLKIKDEQGRNMQYREITRKAEEEKEQQQQQQEEEEEKEEEEEEEEEYYRMYNNMILFDEEEAAAVVTTSIEEDEIDSDYGDNHISYIRHKLSNTDINAASENNISDNRYTINNNTNKILDNTVGLTMREEKILKPGNSNRANRDKKKRKSRKGGISKRGRSEEEREIEVEYYDNESIVGNEDPDASLSHMWAELDNLDAFFTKDSSEFWSKPSNDFKGL
ncbi:Tao3p SCDLUD_002809 [Saccharomycodes ludwigii]|uniref:Tao3p n=1 Tax=Saccharomycodes ludwigii TaxID=36035 RepID=UPI001E81E107|nr:hypothetical protein SCDLUD_002809 [Saccharomycodes ludwigii]KAH3901318.1 hypothetical protein SCDLUD_002809 [Saccharomycodes ludwigii]